MRESTKNAKKPQKRILAHNIKYMTIVFDSSHFNTYFTPNNVVCQVSWQTRKVLTTLCEKVPKTLKNLKNAT